MAATERRDAARGSNPAQQHQQWEHTSIPDEVLDKRIDVARAQGEDAGEREQGGEEENVLTGEW
ncbi:hypothetical protein TrVFT333_006631 [Trichoderma virens FT-333]|nr:hypothetical protein TrVFT333_006631 [Trichoderma virens FT-333]